MRNVKAIVFHHGIERLAFFTLTFKDHVLDPKEAQRRFNSLATNILNDRYQGRWIKVIERMVSGRIHYHLIVVLDSDVRSGANFEEFAEENYRSANVALRREWAYWRETAKNFGFGRTEMLPIKSSDEAIAKYVGKYIAKHIGAREERDKGVRLVSYGKGCPGLSTCKFSWFTPGAKNFRRKLAFVAAALGYKAENYQESFRRDFGARWAFNLGQWIMRIKFLDYPTAEEANSDWPPNLRSQVLQDFLKMEVYDKGLLFSPGVIDCSISAGGYLGTWSEKTKREAIFVALTLRNSAREKEGLSRGRRDRSAELTEADCDDVRESAPPCRSPYTRVSASRPPCWIELSCHDE